MDGSDPGSVIRDSILPGKSASEIINRPYRKPTQVDEMNILRRSSDLSLRN